MLVSHTAGIDSVCVPLLNIIIEIINKRKYVLGSYVDHERLTGKSLVVRFFTVYSKTALGVYVTDDEPFNRLTEFPSNLSFNYGERSERHANCVMCVNEILVDV